jgi:hypothetical protein
MKILPISLGIALLLSSSIGQPISISGNYGRAWLENYGNKNIVPNSTSLWDWGHVPLGNILQNGKLTSIGNSGTPIELFYPAFPTNTTPIFQNRSLMASGYSGLSPADLSSPYLTEDPWFAAQTIGQPILYQSNPPF